MAYDRDTGRWTRKEPLGRGEKGLARAALRKAADKAGGQSSTLNRRGHNSRSQEWPREWRTLKKELERDGITTCERCGRADRLTPAHSLKRRHITSRTHMREVAILCVECHAHFELMGEEKMSKAIRKIIAARSERRLEAA